MTFGTAPPQPLARILAAIWLPPPIRLAAASAFDHLFAEGLLKVLRLTAHVVQLCDQGLNFLWGQARQAAAF
jgi:hypothetical protein